MRSLCIRSCKAVLPIVAVTLGLAAANVRAQDPVTVCPNNFKVLAEDETTRVLRFTQKKGETCGMHSHPYIVAYVIKSGQLTYIMPDGTKKQGPKLKPGEVLQREPTTHSHDAAPEDAEAIVVEVKKQ
jgi:quercetin dioxygenase-like cupin family protein